MIITEKDNLNKIKHKEYILKANANGWGLKSNGFIYKVTQGFRAISSTPTYIKDGKVMQTKFEEADKHLYEIIYIKKDSFIEFRFEYDAHCRNEDGAYFCIDSAILGNKCEPYGKILPSIKFSNFMNLKEILETKSYLKLKGN